MREERLLNKNRQQVTYDYGKILSLDEIADQCYVTVKLYRIRFCFTDRDVIQKDMWGHKITMLSI